MTSIRTIDNILLARQAANRLKQNRYVEGDSKQISKDFQTVRSSRIPIDRLAVKQENSQPNPSINSQNLFTFRNLRPDFNAKEIESDPLEEKVKAIVAKIPNNVTETYKWTKEFSRLARTSGDNYLKMVGDCIYNGSDSYPGITIAESVLQFTRAQVELGRIPEFEEDTLTRLAGFYEKEFNSHRDTVKAESLKVEQEKQEKQEKIDSSPVGTVMPYTGQSQEGRKGLAKSNFGGGDYISHLIASLYNSSAEQIIQVYKVVGIEEWKKDINSLDSRSYDIASIVYKLHSSSDPLAQELKNVCIEVIKSNPQYVIRDIVFSLTQTLHLSLKRTDRKDPNGVSVYYSMPEEDKELHLENIKKNIELFQLSGEDLFQAIIEPILGPEKGMSGGIQHMNSGTAKYDVEKFFKLIGYLEKTTDYKPDMEQVSKAIFEKALSKFLPQDGLYGMPLTEDITYLVSLPRELGLNIDNLDFVRKYGESGWFNTVLITTINRAIKTGNGIIGGYNSEYMTEFCNQYKKYINFNGPGVVSLVDILKDRDETGKLSGYTAEQILLDASLGRQLHEQLSKYGSPGDIPLIESIQRLTGEKPFWIEPQQ
jgi:hypothetical protein